MNRGLQVRVLVVCLALVAGLSALSGRLIYLQWDSGESRESSSSHHSETYVLRPRSGYIVDRNEEVIARNNPVTTIALNINYLGDASTTAAGVAYARAVLHEEWPTASAQRKDSILKNIRSQINDTRSKEEIVQRHLSFLVNILTTYLDEYEHRDDLLKEIGPIGVGSEGMKIIARDVSEDVADKIQEAVEENRIRGLILKKSFKRIYTHPEIGAHVIGITSFRPVKEGSKEERMVGVSGIEKSQAHYLSGKDGYETRSRNARSLALGKTSGVVKPPIPGLDVQLSLDLGYQTIVEEELDMGLAYAHAERGAVVVMNPKTGEVLAMASRPTYNLNKRENIATAGVNYATQAIYEPGSTFKMIATSAAIECGLANPWTRVFCHNGVYNELKPPLRDRHLKGVSWLSLREVLARSSNIGTYKFAKMVGRERFYDYVEAYGFGSRTGIALGGEQAGLVPRTSNQREFASRSYGYAVNVTPLQIANAYCVIANGGQLMKPLLVKSVIMPNGQRLHSFEPEVVRQVISSQTAKMMREALATVTQAGGTATAAAVPGYEVAGKTGTAQKVVNGGYDKNSHVVSFAGMLPAKDPAFVCVVVIDDPKVPHISHGGGSLAAPVFSKVAGRLASAMHLKPTQPIRQPLARQ